MGEKGAAAPSLDRVDGKAFLEREREREREREEGSVDCYCQLQKAKSGIWRRKPDGWDMENHLLSVGSQIGLNQWQIVGLV